MRTRNLRVVGVFMALALLGAACSDDEPTTAPPDTGAEATTDMTEQPVDSATICDTDGLVAAVEGGPAEGTLDGMTDDPVGTAASNNPVLTTLVTAVSEAGLVDTLNGAEALTVFAPTDCAFANLDEETLNAALADPTGLLTQVLGYHVLTERIEPADLSTGSYATFTGGELEVEVDGDTISVGGGQATVLVPGIQTENATVYLIDSVMLPPQLIRGVRAPASS